MDRGREHSAACTVAFGVQEVATNNRSLAVRFFPKVQANAVGNLTKIPVLTIAQLFKMLSAGIIFKSKAAPIEPKSSGRTAISQTMLTSRPIRCKKSAPEHCVSSITLCRSQISFATVPIKRVPTAPLASNPARLCPHVIKRPNSIAIAVRCHGCGQNRAAAKAIPPTQPVTIPRKIATGPCKKAVRAKLSLPSIAIPMQMVKPVMATMSSRAHAAMTSEGIPFPTPYPLCCKPNMPGITMAGDTAARMNPSESASANGISNIQCDTTAVPIASTRPGKHVRRRDTPPALATALASISVDEIRRMLPRIATRAGNCPLHFEERCRRSTSPAGEECPPLRRGSPRRRMPPRGRPRWRRRGT